MTARGPSAVRRGRWTGIAWAAALPPESPELLEVFALDAPVAAELLSRQSPRRDLTPDHGLRHVQFSRDFVGPHPRIPHAASVANSQYGYSLPQLTLSVKNVIIRGRRMP